MNQLVFYLNRMNYQDYKRLLISYLPKQVLSDELLIQFANQLYSHADQFKLKDYFDIQEWLEEETERFCTVNPHTGYPFQLKRATR